MSNISTIDENEKKAKVENITTSKSSTKKSLSVMPFLKSNSKIIMICVAILFIILLSLYFYNRCQNNNTNNKITNPIDNKNNKTDNDNNKESYKTSQVRDDPYDEYDLENEIHKLVKKQEKYLEKITKY